MVSAATKRPELPPPLGAEGNQEHSTALKAWLEYGIRYRHPYRIRLHSLWRRADLYYQAKQWLVRSYTTDAYHTPHWSEVEYADDAADAIPTPTFNRFSGLVENEAARLSRPEYKGYVRPEGDKPDPETREGARISTNALHQILDDTKWPEKRDRGLHLKPLHGGWYLKSYWDTTWEETVRVPEPDALRCPNCGMTLSSPKLPEDKALDLMFRPDLMEKEQYLQDGDVVTEHRLKVCVKCTLPVEETELEPGMEAPTPEPQPLEPYVPIDKALNQKDYFGRPLGKDVPLGRPELKTMSSYDVFPANLGIGVDAANIEEWWESHVESLEWVRNRYQNGWKVKPERGEALREWHPIVGERALYYDTGIGCASLLDNHVRVLEFHKAPWREDVKDAAGKTTGELKVNRGRSLVMANDVVLFDGDLMIESKSHPGRLIPRCMMHYAPWALRSGGLELNGVSMSESIFDPQDNRNEIVSQLQDCRQTLGSPKHMVTRGMNLGYETGGEAGARYVWDPDPRFPSLEPDEVGNTLLNPQVYQELEVTDEQLQDSGKSRDVEQGVQIPNASSALYLQVMAEQTGEQRRPRIRRIREMLERAFRHLLQLAAELVREPRQMWIEDEVGSFHQQSWTGLDFADQTDVRIDVEPDHDTNLVQQQTLRDWVTLYPQLQGMTPRSIRLIADKIGVPREIFEQEKLQDDAAWREFTSFKEGTAPVVDPDLDDHSAHYDRHGIDAMSEWFRDLETDAGWDKALPLLWGWEPTFYTQVNPMLDMTPGAPKALELRIFQFWTLTLQQSGYQPTSPEQDQALQRVMRFRAHMSTHKTLGESAKQAAAGGEQVLAAPGGAETAQGTEPTLGQPEQAPEIMV